MVTAAKLILCQIQHLEVLVAPKGIITIETIIDSIARKLTRPIEEIRNINLYSKNNGLKTPYGQIVNDSDRYNKVWDRVCEISNLQKIKKMSKSIIFNKRKLGRL